MKPIVNIKNYFYYMSRWGPMVLCGEVYNHPLIENDHHVVTSPIIWSDMDENTSETENTLYKRSSPLLALNEYWIKKLASLRMDPNMVIFEE